MSLPRSTGKFAQIMIGGVTFANAHETVIRERVETLSSRAYGDAAPVKQSDFVEYEITMRKYCRTADLGGFLGLGLSTVLSGSLLRVVVYQAPGVKIFEADCVPNETSLTMPTGHVEEEITLEVSGSPIFVA